MSPESARMTATISRETLARLQRVAQVTGVGEGQILEAALDQFLDEFAQLPSSALIAPRIVVDRRTGARILARIAEASEPTDAMRALFRS